MRSAGDLSEDSIFLHESVIRGHHIFKEIWTPYTGEILLVRKEAGNVHDRRAVALLKADGTVVQWTCTKGGFKNFLALSRPWWYNLM